MNRIEKNKQKGAATLLTALVLLISISLVTLLASKTVINETQIAADNYRTEQAVAAANAAMDFAVGYFGMTGGLDHNNDGCPEYLSTTYTYYDPKTRTNKTCSASAPRTFEYKKNGTNENIGTATLTFSTATGASNRCKADTALPSYKLTWALVTAVGFSDDGLASRTITQCLGSFDPLGGNSPKQSLVTKGGVGLTGNYSVINRYYNTTAWSGLNMNIGASASASTTLRKFGTDESSFTRAQLESPDITPNAYTSEVISDRNKGNGVDVIGNDPRLSSLAPDEFFNNFFVGDRLTVRKYAFDQGQVYTSTADAIGKSGIVWIEGNSNPFTMTGGTYGTADNPIIMIIDGNLRTTGTPQINGLLYVRGQFYAGGTVGVLGSVVVEGDPAKVPAGEDPVVGNGTVDLIYSPYTLDRAANPFKGTTTTISGSWRDW